MPDRRILAALGLPTDGDEREIAEGLRRLSGHSSSAAPGVPLWMRFYDGIELARQGSTGARGDTALLANRIVEYAIVPPREAGEEEFGLDAWERELGHPAPNADEALRMFVIDEIAPRLERAGLYALL
jgi:hypothetical protein